MNGRDPYRPSWGNDDEHVHDANDHAGAHSELAGVETVYIDRCVAVITEALADPAVSPNTFVVLLVNRFNALLEGHA